MPTLFNPRSEDVIKVLGEAWPVIQAMVISTAVVIGAVAIPALIMYVAV